MGIGEMRGKIREKKKVKKKGGGGMPKSKNEMLKEKERWKWGKEALRNRN